MANTAAMREMEDTIWIAGVPLKAIVDPVVLTHARAPGGKGVDGEFEIYVPRDEVLRYNIRKGTKISFRWNMDTKNVRVGPIEDDGTNLLILMCHSELKGGVPGL